MNKQELITRIKRLDEPYLKMELILDLIKKIDKPQKPVVPQFVSDWYEENKDDFEGNLFRCAHNIPSTFDGAKLNEFERWFLNASIKAFQILVNMHQFGYTIEKEKRYTVKMKNLRALFCYLAYIPDEGYWSFMASGGKSIVIKHTRKQLEEAGFGWVFDCEGIEIEEVQDDSKI